MHRNASATSGPRVLLAEDDPATAEFLRVALVTIGCEVTTCSDGSLALEEARRRVFDFLLVDRNLPGLGAPELLPRLRADPQAASRQALAAATSAEWTAADRAAALAAGYIAALGKPCTLAELRLLLEGQVPAARWPARHDDAALAATGSAAALAALRRIFGRELQQLAADLPELARDGQAIGERLHRLCASAGFCGAPALAAAARAWLADLRAGTEPGESHADFARALAEAQHAFPDPGD